MKQGVTIVIGGRGWAFDLAAELAKRGWLHRLISNYPKFKVRKWQVPEDKIISLPGSMLMAQAVRRLLGEKQMVRWQYRIHQQFARAAAKHIGTPAIVHGWSSFSEPAQAFCRTKMLPFVLERGSAHITEQTQLLVQESARWGLNNEVTHPEIIAMELREYASADRICVPSHFVEKTFLDRGVAQGKLYLNILGVNRATFTPGQKKDGKFRIIFVGGLTYRKGIQYLCDAFRRAALPDGELLLVGGDVAETESLIGQPRNGFVRTGHVPQARLVEYYRQSSVFAIASIEEGMAMVQAQALACGLPLICSANTGGEDLLLLGGKAMPMAREGDIKEYPAGYVVPIRNPEALATCFRRLHADRALLRDKGEATKRILEQPMDWAAYAERTIKLYRTLIG